MPDREEEVVPAAARTRRPLVLTALVLAMFLAAIEGTIVATAMPSIAAKLGGFSLYSWVFSAFLLMQAVTIPIFGKLADLLGRKPVFIAGILVFLLGSVLCGFASSMGMLVGFRFLQGLGAGAVQPITTTLAGDLYSLEERGRVQGYLSSVWGASSVVGPLAGGLIVQHASWSWIFWLNVPFGLVTIVLIVLFLHEDVEGKARSIDYTGAGLLLVGLSALMLALTQGAEWGAWIVAPLLLVFGTALFSFIRQESRAADPLIHLELWSSRMIRYANVATLTAGIAMIGLISFVPTFVQGVLGRTALVAGFALSAMSVGWPIASVVAGRLFVSVGVRAMARAGGIAAVVGALWIALTAGRGALEVGIGSFVMGVGFGLMNTTYIVAIQTSVSWAQRGVATASNMLMRILGNALGAAIFGGVLNFKLRHFLPGGVSLDSINDLLGGGAGQAASRNVDRVLREGLSAGLHLVFWGILLVAVITLAASWLVPNLPEGMTGDGSE
ncbi:MAG TPA: MDR family MFS transporter [Rhodothermales bacterium]|nr:MDR family MFS transporter [Rhodothermales bacterium]